MELSKEPGLRPGEATEAIFGFVKVGLPLARPSAPNSVQIHRRPEDNPRPSVPREEFQSMHGTATVVASDMASTRRSLTDAGFDDEQVQALIDMTGTAAERLTIKADVAELKQGVSDLTQRTDLLSEQFSGLRAEFESLRREFDGFRREIVARIEASEERVTGQIATLDGRVDGVRSEMNARFDGLEGRVNAKIDGLGGRLKLMLWFMGIGLTLYTGTTVSLIFLLFRDVQV